MAQKLMALFKCKVCGAGIPYEVGAEAIGCSFCGSVYTLSPAEVVDETRTFTIETAVAPGALARIEHIFVHNTTTGDVFRVYPDAIASAAPGDELNITVKTFNDGAPGDIWNRIKDDTGAVLEEERRYRETGEALITIAIHVPMPARDYTITVEAGHIA